MTGRIHIRRAPGTWVIRAGGAILGESRNALELTEGDMPPVIFFPREDVAMAFLDPTPTRSRIPCIGEATHFAVTTPDARLTDAAWTCEEPEAAAERIAGYVAFAPRAVTVEML